MNDSSIVFVVTGAHSIPNASPILLRERFIEYMIALQKIALYQKPMYGVLSEVDRFISDLPPFHRFCNAGLLQLPPEALAYCQTKSQKEFLSIQSLLSTMDLSDDAFVVKVSGRYIIMKDSFLNTVESVKNNPQIQGVVYLTPDKQQYTFLFALRWKWFKKFYSKSVSHLHNKNLEQCIVEFYEEEGILDKLYQVSSLDIFTQICNANQFQMF